MISDNYIDKNKIIKVFEHFKFWIQEEYNNDDGTEESKYSRKDLLGDRIELIDRLAISLEIKIAETWDENEINLLFCDLCNEIIIPSELSNYFKDNIMINYHFKCLEEII